MGKSMFIRRRKILNEKLVNSLLFIGSMHIWSFSIAKHCFTLSADKYTLKYCKEKYVSMLITTFILLFYVHTSTPCMFNLLFPQNNTLEHTNEEK
jgi:hypothetical protein